MLTHLVTPKIKAANNAIDDYSVCYCIARGTKWLLQTHASVHVHISIHLFLFYLALASLGEDDFHVKLNLFVQLIA